MYLSNTYKMLLITFFITVGSTSLSFGNQVICSKQIARQISIQEGQRQVNISVIRQDADLSHYYIVANVTGSHIADGHLYGLIMNKSNCKFMGYFGVRDGN